LDILLDESVKWFLVLFSKNTVIYFVLLHYFSN